MSGNVPQALCRGASVPGPRPVHRMLLPSWHHRAGSSAARADSLLSQPGPRAPWGAPVSRELSDHLAPYCGGRPCSLLPGIAESPRRPPEAGDPKTWQERPALARCPVHARRGLQGILQHLGLASRVGTRAAGTQPLPEAVPLQGEAPGAPLSPPRWTQGLGDPGQAPRMALASSVHSVCWRGRRGGRGRRVPAPGTAKSGVSGR